MFYHRIALLCDLSIFCISQHSSEYQDDTFHYLMIDYFYDRDKISGWNAYTMRRWTQHYFSNDTLYTYTYVSSDSDTLCDQSFFCLTTFYPNRNKYCMAWSWDLLRKCDQIHSSSDRKHRTGQRSQDCFYKRYSSG